MKQTVWRLIAPRLGDLLRLSNRKVGIAIVHHRVGDPPGQLERELVPALGAAEFEAQVRHLAARYRVVPACELRAAIVSRRRGERIPVAITFDDDLESHRTVAAPMLLRAGVPATFFLTGASLDGPSRFWWERLQDVMDRGLDVRDLPGDGSIHEVAAKIKLLEPEHRAEVNEHLGELAGADPPTSGLRTEDVRWLADAGFEIGFHTLRHDYLPNLDDAALLDAMEEGRERLAEAAGQPVRTIAYPHGGSDERVAAAARASGFEAGFTVAAEAATAATDPFLIGRVDPLYHGTGVFRADIGWRLWKAA